MGNARNLNARAVKYKEIMKLKSQGMRRDEIVESLNSRNITTMRGLPWIEQTVSTFVSAYRKSAGLPKVRKARKISVAQTTPKIFQATASKDAYDLVTMVAASNLPESKKRAVITAMCAE